MQYVPVVDVDQKPLMPTTANRAASWIKSGKATPFWKRGIFCVRLNIEPSGRETQPIAVGIDPGSKKEGYTVKSAAHTYLNINADAVTWVGDAVETRGNLRRSRLNRKTPCRPNRSNRGVGFRIPPSTRARWGWKLRIASWLSKMFPIAVFVVEDIAAKTIKGGRKWNKSFSPLEVGKQWFYTQIANLAPVETKQGMETKQMRDAHGLKKSKSKMAAIFSAHCVDSWVLSNWFTGGHTKPDNESILCVTPFRFHRRQLQVQNPAKGGQRKEYGSTRSMGFERGTLVGHSKRGLAFIGGASKGRISLHDVGTGERLGQNFKPADCKFLSFASWRAFLPSQTSSKRAAA
jgi:hypothetical protein